MNKIIVIGQMDNAVDHTHEQQNRVYDVNGCCPTISTCGGGGREPKILTDESDCLWKKTRDTESEN